MLRGQHRLLTCHQEIVSNSAKLQSSIDVLHIRTIIWAMKSKYTEFSACCVDAIATSDQIKQKLWPSVLRSINQSEEVQNRTGS